MVLRSFTVVVENNLNLCGVLTFEFVCVHVQVMYANFFAALNLAGWWINQKNTFPTLYQVFLFVMAHLMSSAQIEKDFSAASLVLSSNRGSMDARYFQD